MLLLLTLSGLANAQDTAGGAVPNINAQLFRPSIDADRFLWSDDTTVTSMRFGGRVVFDWVNQPLVYVTDDGTRTALVDNLFQANVLAGYGLGPVRLGVDVPVYLRSFSDTGGETGLGDIGVDGKLRLLDRAEKPLGLGLNARLTLPTANLTGVEGPLGYDSVGWEIAVIADKDLGPVLLAANIGTRGVPDIDPLENVEWGDQLFARVGAGYAVTENGGVSLDFAGSGVYGEFGNPAGRPVEALLGGWGRPGGGNLVLRGGVGTGVTSGIGAPRLRVVGAVGWEPPRAGDKDGDGILDADDACPDSPEDKDSYMDEDGCPEPTLVSVRFVDATGSPIPGVSATIEGGESPLTGSGWSKQPLDKGKYGVKATAPGFMPLDASFSVPDGPPVEIDQAMQEEAAKPGSIKVIVKGPDGKPADANVIINGEKVKLTDGVGGAEAMPGAVVVTVEAEGFLSRKKQFSVESQKEDVWEITLKPAKAKVSKERIDISDSVYFETNKAVIKSESFDLLDQVATIMKDNPELQLLRIEGHTDSRGDAAYNKELSEKRASAVRTYLIGKGVQADRLSSIGYGEEKPIDKANNAKAWEKNRRVDFFIEKRSD